MKIKKYFILLFYKMTTAVNRKEIEMSNLEDYETLYKVDLNFDADVSEMDSILEAV